MNIKDISSDLQRKINMVLGREVSTSEAGNVASFADFSSADIEEFRKLEKSSGILAVSYIRFRLGGSVELDAVASYYASVIQQGVSVEEWSKSE